MQSLVQFVYTYDKNQHGIGLLDMPTATFCLTPIVTISHVNKCVYAVPFATLNPFTAPACKISGLKRSHIHAWKQNIWWSYNRSTFNTAHFDINHFTCSCERGKSLNDLKLGTFVGRFPSDGVASMAVKGLMFVYIVLRKTPMSVQYPWSKLTRWQTRECSWRLVQELMEVT